MGNLTVKESGEMVNIISPNVSKITSFKVHFSPRQEGSGDPSPENVREITGWNGVEGYISNVAQSNSLPSNILTAAIDWTEDVGTVYGGYVDLISGELVQTWYGFILDGVNNYLNSTPQLLNNGLATIYDYMGSGGLNNLPNGVFNAYAYTGSIICNKFPLAYNKENEGIATGSGSLYVRLLLDPSKLEDVSTTSAIRESMIKWQQENPLQIVYKLREPIHYQLTPQQLLTFKGTNNIYSNTNGQTEIKYWKH